MSTLPAHNPALPYLGRIPGGLQPGVMMHIRAHIADMVQQFIKVNVQTGPALGPSDDINLHLSIRLDQNVIVRNHMKNQCWGHEERVGGCPIGRGQFIEMIILAQTDCFKVAINGSHFCEFNHRLPLSSAQFIYVDGEMTIDSITLSGDVSSVPSIPSYGSVPLMPMPTSTTSGIYLTPTYQPMHQQTDGYQPLPHAYSPSSNFPSHSPYPNYP